VSIDVTSISSYIPPAEDNEKAFCGVTQGDTTQYLSAHDGEEARTKEIETQWQDAQERVVVWDAESLAVHPFDDDADGEPDPEFERASQQIRPLGVRGENGQLRDIPSEDTCAPSDPQFMGASEVTPLKAADLVRCGLSGLLTMRC
jgi:hypothetical protein